MLIINADDWGRDVHTTNRILTCTASHSISSVSAMVFMDDSERAAVLARDHRIDAGLHLNFDTVFTEARIAPRLLQHQAALASFVGPLSRVIFHPGLQSSFEYVVSAQLEEYQRLYGSAPHRIDGHHHLHLCANVLLSGLLSSGTVLRPHFSYEQGEKRARNFIFRCYSKLILKRYRTVEYLFALAPMTPLRLMHIFALSKDVPVEVETHPVDRAEFEFLASDTFRHMIRETHLAATHLT